MKKFFAVLFFCSSALVFADNFKPELHISPSVRQQGFGGFYTTDVDNFYGIYSNPAMLGKRKKHSLYPGFGFNCAGPIADIPDFFKALTNQDVNLLSDILRKNNGIKLGTHIEPLLSFGHTTEWGFGWAFNTNIFVNASIPGLTRSDIQAGIESVLTAGFGFPLINTDNHLLSIGATAKGFYQLSTSLNDGVLSVAQKIKDFEVKNISLNSAVGFGFDIGIYYSLCNALDFAIVYHDPWSQAWVSKVSIPDVFSFNFNQGNRLESKLSAGICYKIPVASTRGLISSFRIMADYQNIFTVFKKFSRNPLLEISAGTEIVLFDMLSIRLGINEMYPAAGIGLAFGKFKIDLSMYGKELGLEPGSSPCLNAGLFIGITY